ncbi:MAG: multicopper oxidase domain-containing protein [Pseudonocardia sp.]|nr:multicopper oxidase domain-containing protein [Pseudonocardia sp.]
MTLYYDVVAISVPIVYTGDGDHDPNGLMFAPRAHKPLLQWIRESLDDRGRSREKLADMHERRQWAQLVVDGLPRYERMLDRLASGPETDRYLIQDLGGEIDKEARPDEHDRSRRRHRNPRAAAVRQNVLATVDELVAALGELTDGAVDRLSSDRATRMQWWQRWRTALPGIDAAIEARVADLRDPRELANAALSRDEIARLMYNDRKPGNSGPRYDRCNPLKPIPVVRPLVLRGRVGEAVQVDFENSIEKRHVGFHVQGDGLHGQFDQGASGTSPGPAGAGVRFADGAAVGINRSTVTPPNGRHTFAFECLHEGAWPINDLGDVRSSENGTNLHGLFGALIVEPAGATWWDPETGEGLTHRGRTLADVDVVMPRAIPSREDYVDLHSPPGSAPCSHREFTVFIHDEPEIHSGHHVAGGEHTVMPLSYRAEPMPNRLPHRMRRLAEATPLTRDPHEHGIDHSAVGIELDEELGEVFRTARDHDATATEPPADSITHHEGPFLERVAGEEQHHSSWLFGDPVTPIFRAYKGDPARVRVIHAGVKETHVFHLHVHQWRAVPEDSGRPSVDGIDSLDHRSQLLDSITIGPQAAITIDPLYGSGSRQHTPGDVIWHCHLYPHFHHGMWGLWRSFDRWVDGSRAYPDGTPCHPLQPLPGRLPEGHPNHPEAALDTGRPGFPWFVDATVPRKSPPPPAILDHHVGGRRRLLRMPNHSVDEYAAFAQGCKNDPQPGALFVDLDGDARTWNATAGLDAPRVLHYDVEVDQSTVTYNSQDWYDRNGHHYRITAITETTTGPDGLRTTVPRAVPARPVETFFPRANHGDVVELTFLNRLGTIPPDGFDLRTPPVECGLHVHLVKFDVMTADGSSTGWNYLSGASCAEAVAGAHTRPGDMPVIAGLHRWVVDEEFGPCFFHDHLLANYRQKHGLFAALIAEPHGSTWLNPEQDAVAWTGPEAVVTYPEQGRRPGHPPPTPEERLPSTAFREACLGIGDFVCLHDAEHAPLNPPGELGGDDDPGTMAVNFRCTPLTFRGDDPSRWFSDEAGSIDTPVIRTYAGERLRIRLIQGSHEEQHSFVAHGLRWRREWHRPTSTLVDQQTLGISEAFTLDLHEKFGAGYGPGDHLWQFAAIDDLWLGCWGLVRALRPGEVDPEVFPPLPDPDRTIDDPPPNPLVRTTPAKPSRDSAGAWRDPETGGTADVREFVVRARRVEHLCDGTTLTDPWGLVFEVVADGASFDQGFVELPDDRGRPRDRRETTPPGTSVSVEPLVLRARRGEWVRVLLVNEVLDGTDDDDRDPLQQRFEPEPSPPRVPLESLDEQGYPDKRKVSPRVSLHASLLRYDVTTDDGSWVGGNHDSTVGTLGTPEDLGEHGDHAGGDVVFREHHGTGSHGDPNWREYWWFVDGALGSDSHRTGPGQVCLLRDAADVRNHRHHGLVGALVVEPDDIEPRDPATGLPRWWGVDARIVSTVDGSLVATESVLIVQDGLRLFVAGNPESPVRDVVVGDDPEDAGQKGVNYRTEPVHPSRMLAVPAPSTPVVPAQVGTPLWLRLLCAGDKPRNHSFTVHGMAWNSAPWLKGTAAPWAGSLSGLTAGTVHDLVLYPEHPGDHAYRSGAFRWAVENGVWGIVRVE